MAAKFELYKDKGNQFRFRLKAANGEIIATGESYPDKKSLQKGIASIQKNAPVAKIEDTTIAAEEKKPAKEKTPAKEKKPVAKTTAAKKPAVKKATTRKPAAKKTTEPKPAE